MLNFNEITADIATLAQRAGDADYSTKIKVWVRLAHKTLTEIYDYWNELQDIYNFTSVESQADYPLPNNFDKPFRLYDITNDRKMVWKSEENYFDSNISNVADGTEGDVSTARIYGATGTRVAISSSGDTVQVKSSSTSDNDAPTIRIRGYIDSTRLIEDFEDIVVSSSTPTTFASGTKTFYDITHVSKSGDTVGYITIANSSDETLETLAPTDRVARHKVLKLGLIPDDSATSFRLLFKRTIPTLVDDNDYPFTECDRYLIMDGWGWSLAQDKENERAEHAWQKSKEALQAILTNQGNKYGSDFQHKAISTWLQAHRNR